MDPETFITTIINPGLELVASVGGPPPTNLARHFLLAVALLESGPGLDARYQNSPSVSAGPARGFWQFEQNGGVWDVLNRDSAKRFTLAVCARCTVQPHLQALWRALEGHDLLAASCARLLLWTDPKPLPTSEVAGWDSYIRTWRPGKPHQTRWPGHWQTAAKTVSSVSVA